MKSRANIHWNYKDMKKIIYSYQLSVTWRELIIVHKENNGGSIL
jgi:hypothetical protein